MSKGTATVVGIFLAGVIIIGGVVLYEKRPKGSAVDQASKPPKSKKKGLNELLAETIDSVATSAVTAYINKGASATANGAKAEDQEAAQQSAMVAA